MEFTLNPVKLFPVEREYECCIDALYFNRVITILPGSKTKGIIGIDGKRYPVPTLEQVKSVFDNNRDLADRKFLQGFSQLRLTPMAMPVQDLIDRLQNAVISHAGEMKIFQTRHSASFPLIPVRVNTKKQVWVWDTLRKMVESGKLVYFPREYSLNHHGLTKPQVIKNKLICAIPGWSIGLVEGLPTIPQPGQGMSLENRKQIEIGFSPREYLQALQTDAYMGETGKTVEDFITEFIIRLEMTGEVSNDRYDNNALWLLGNYVEYVEQVKSDLVPSAWWHRDYGRVRFDAHRPGNKHCTKSWGVSTIVRLAGTK
jgi:hypothetical protein